MLVYTLIVCLFEIRYEYICMLPVDWGRWEGWEMGALAEAQSVRSTIHHLYRIKSGAPTNQDTSLIRTLSRQNQDT